MTADDALRLLTEAGYSYSSPIQLVAQSRLPGVEAALGLRPTALSNKALEAESLRASPFGRGFSVGTTEDGDETLVADRQILRKGQKKPRHSPAEAKSGPLRHQYDLPIVGHPPSGTMNYLDSRAVLDIHQQLVRDFALKDDPIDPPGVRDRGQLLESALTRPRTSLNGRLKYPTVQMAAAALLHALVHDHPFHNGNKRTGIVALLVFLDQNGYVLQAEETELFEYVLALAGHGISAPSLDSPSSDAETINAARWIADHARKLDKAQKTLKWKDLEARLRTYGCTFESRRGNQVTIRRDGLIAHTGRRNTGAEIGVDGVATIRKQLQLDEAQGVDSSSFYYDATIVPEFINKYRQVLRRLASY